MNREPCTESDLRKQADLLHQGNLEALRMELKQRLIDTVWPPGRLHLQKDLKELEAMIRHDAWLKAHS